VLLVYLVERDTAIIGNLKQGYIKLCKVIHLTAVGTRIETRSPLSQHHAVLFALNRAFKAA